MRHRNSFALPGFPRRAPQSLFCAPQGEQVPKAQGGSRVLVVQLSSFRLERCGWRWDEPVVLLAEERSALRIQAATLAARRLGMMRGMSISESPQPSGSFPEYDVSAHSTPREQPLCGQRPNIFPLEPP